MIELIFGITFILSVAFNGADVSVGTSIAEPVINANGKYISFSPEGEVEFKTKPNSNVELFARHISSVPYAWDNYKNTSFNSVGIRGVLHFDGFIKRK